MNNTKRILVCIVGIIFIFSSLGVVYAVDPVEPDPVTDLLIEQYLRYMYEVLQSWGINIDWDGAQEYSDEISQYLWELVQEFLATLPSIDSFSNWVMPWKLVIDEWGRLKGNQNFLQDMQDFTDWLVVELALASNTTEIIIQGLRYVEDTQGNKYFVGDYQSEYERLGTPVYTFNKLVESSETKYFQGGNYKFVFASHAPNPNGSNNQERKGYTEYYKYQLINGQYSLLNVTTQNYGDTWDEKVLRFFYFPGGTVSGTYHAQGVYAFVDTRYKNGNVPSGWEPVYQWNVNLSSTVSGQLAVVTDTLVVPSDTGDDSIIVDDGEAIYVEITWPDSIDISNLPAVVSTGTIPVPGEDNNPGLVNAWRPISSLITMTADAMSMVVGIVYEFPEEVIVPIYAVMGGLIIFGIIHAMKEH